MRLKIKKIDIHDLILKLILLFPITTIIQGIQIFSPINKIINGIIFLSLLFIAAKNINKKTFILNILILTSTVISFVLSDNFNFSINYLFYYPIFGLFCTYIADNAGTFKIKIKENIKLIKLVIFLWSFIVFISLFFKSSYNNIWGWGDDFYFMSFSNGVPHRLASSSAFILAMIFVWLVEEEAKHIKIYLLAILPTASILMSGARIYLIVLGLTLLMIYYNECKKNKIFWYSVLPIGIISFIIICISPMGKKMVDAIQNQYATDVLSAFSSGRSEFWLYDLKYFFSLNPYFQLFGGGVSFVFNVNFTTIGMNVYAHNDFIQVLTTYGYIGMIEYLAFTTIATKRFFYNEKIKTKFFVVTIFLTYFSVAFLNGFYVYPCTLFSLPLLFYCSIFKDGVINENEK